MRIAFLGDSITEGCGASCMEKTFVSQVGSKLDVEVLNYGIGGSRIARQASYDVSQRPLVFDWDFQQRALIIQKDVDYVFIFGGTNDYGHGDSSMGDYSTHDPYTFRGATRNLFEYLISTFGKEKLCVILPTRRCVEEEFGRKLIEFVDSLKYLSNEYGLNVINLYDDGLPKPDTEGPSQYYMDGLHPNDTGHEFIADKICEFLKNSNRL